MRFAVSYLRRSDGEATPRMVTLKMKKLRPYQQSAIDAVNIKLSQGISKQLMVLPTGAGKTFTAVKAVGSLKRKIWLTHTEELLEQSGAAFLHELFPNANIQKRINDAGGLTQYIKSVKSQNLFADPVDAEIVSKIGVVKAEMFDIGPDIVLASMQTLHRRLDRIDPNSFDAILVDEAHMSTAPTIVKSINHFKPKLLLGLTATPHRSDGASLGDIFDEITYQYSLFDAINDGYLCELDAIACQTDLSLDEIHTLGGDLNQKELRQTVNTPQRNKFIVDRYRQYADGLQNLVFCVDVQHAQDVCQSFKDAGYKADFVVGDQELTPDRRATIEKFKTGEIQILVNVMVLTAGFDHPGIKCLTLACPTKSLTKFFQQIGRATRTLPGVIDGLDTPELRRSAIAASAKPKAIVLDIVDTTSKHRIVNTWTIDKKVPVAQKVFVTSEKRGQLFKEEEVVAENKRKLDAIRKKDERVNLFAMPEFKPTDSIKMTEPATQPQLDWLKRLGYDTVNNTYTKGSASAIFAALPASAKEIKEARDLGYIIPPGVTKGEIGAARWEAKKRAEADAIKNAVAVNQESDLPF